MESLLKKLDSISHLQVKEAIKSVESDVEKSIKESANFAPKASQYVGKCDVREGKHSYYVDIGLDSEKGNFKDFKELYFHNYGYQDKGLNFGENGPYIDMHKQWFDKAVNTISKKVKKQIKDKLEAELKKVCE